MTFKETREMIRESFEGMLKKDIEKNYVIQPHVSAETLNLNIKRLSRILFNNIVETSHQVNKTILQTTIKDIQDMYTKHSETLLKEELKNIIDLI